MTDKFSSRRILPRVVMSPNGIADSQNAILCSGDFNYFMKYGLALIASKLKNAPSINLIVNCVDFPLSIAEQIVSRFLSVDATSSGIYFVKTDTSVIKHIALEVKASYLRTIRYYVAYILMQKYSVSLSVIDIDSLIVSPRFVTDYQSFLDLNYSFVIGSRADFSAKPLYEIGSNDYLWRTIKAGFSYFRNDKFGNKAIERVFHSLFNTTDAVPPLDNLKMYRAYYGDQICLLLAFLELLSVPVEHRTTNHLSCVGHSKSDFVSFSRDFSNSSLWIPPASAREPSVFSQYFAYN